MGVTNFPQRRGGVGVSKEIRLGETVYYSEKQFILPLLGSSVRRTLSSNANERRKRSNKVEKFGC